MADAAPADAAQPADADAALGAALTVPVPAPELPAAAADAPGPFVSATVHKPLRLGQRLTAADLADDAEVDDGPPTVGRRLAPAGGGRRAPGAPGGGPGGGSGARGGASLLDLVESGVLVPGRNKIAVTYKGVTVAAALTGDGCIEHAGRRYQSATAFSIHFKRTITPSKQGDDGWKSVCYDGRPLEHYRHAYGQQLRARLGRAAAGGGGGFGGGEAGAAAPDAAGGGGGGGSGAAGGGGALDAAGGAGAPAPRKRVRAPRPPGAPPRRRSSAPRPSRAARREEEGDEEEEPDEEEEEVEDEEAFLASLIEEAGGGEAGGAAAAAALAPTPPRARAPPAAPPPPPPPAVVEVLWAQCERCEKWRTVEAAPAEDAQWFCEMKAGFSCATPLELGADQ